MCENANENATEEKPARELSAATVRIIAEAICAAIPDTRTEDTSDEPAKEAGGA